MLGSFKEYLRIREMNIPGYHNDGASGFNPGAIVSSFLSGSETGDTRDLLGHPPSLDSTDMIFPSQIVQGPIVQCDGCPGRAGSGSSITIAIEEPRTKKRTVISMSPHEYRRCPGGPPEMGKTMMVTLQRHPDDMRKQLSIIKTARVF
jgi:hypothetical protein